MLRGGWYSCTLVTGTNNISLANFFNYSMFFCFIHLIQTCNPSLPMFVTHGVAPGQLYSYLCAALAKRHIRSSSHILITFPQLIKAVQAGFHLLLVGGSAMAESFTTSLPCRIPDEPVPNRRYTSKQCSEKLHSPIGQNHQPPFHQRDPRRQPPLEEAFPIPHVVTDVAGPCMCSPPLP